MLPPPAKLHRTTLISDLPCSMKPLKEDLQLRFVSLSYSVALQALEPKSSPRRRRGLDASTDRGLPESSGEVFLLDIPSHRMSVMACVC
jgi:hypothetical protein